MKCSECEHSIYHLSYDDHTLITSECLHPDRPDDCCFNTNPDEVIPIWCPLNLQHEKATP